MTCRNDASSISTWRLDMAVPRNAISTWRFVDASPNSSSIDGRLTVRAEPRPLGRQSPRGDPDTEQYMTCNFHVEIPDVALRKSCDLHVEIEEAVVGDRVDSVNSLRLRGRATSNRSWCVINFIEILQF